MCSAPPTFFTSQSFLIRLILIAFKWTLMNVETLCFPTVPGVTGLLYGLVRWIVTLICVVRWLL